MSVHLFAGEDDYLVESAARKAMAGFAVEEIDSAASGNAAAQLRDIARVRDAYAARSLFDPLRAVWWRNARFLPGAEKLAEDVKEALEDFARRVAGDPPPDNLKLVITAPKLLKTSIFAKTLQSVAEIAVFESAKGWAARQRSAVFAADCASEAGIKFDSGALEAFCAKVGPDSRAIVSEIAKLRDYLGANRKAATTADVMAVTSPGPGAEPELWGVSDAVMRRNAAEALAIAMQFRQDSNFAVAVSSTLERLFRQLLDLDALSDSMPAWQARKFQEALRKWNRQELRAARFRFLNLRERAVSGGESAGELVLAEIVRACKGRAK